MAQLPAPLPCPRWAALCPSLLPLVLALGAEGCQRRSYRVIAAVSLAAVTATPGHTWRTDERLESLRVREKVCGRVRSHAGKKPLL